VRVATCHWLPTKSENLWPFKPVFSFQTAKSCMGSIWQIWWMVKILFFIGWLKPPQEWPCNERGHCHEARSKRQVKVPSLLQPTASHYSANISVMLIYCFTFCRQSMNNALLIKKASTLSSLGFLACVPSLVWSHRSFTLLALTFHFWIVLKAPWFIICDTSTCKSWLEQTSSCCCHLLSSNLFKRLSLQNLQSKYAFKLLCVHT